jgi:cellulose synthase operon protein C
MIFQFPDLETFRLAITSAQVPTTMSSGEVEAAFDEEGHLSVKPLGGMPPKTMQNALKRWGVTIVKEHHPGEVTVFTCWPQVMPLTKESTIPHLSNQAPVLFELPASDLVELVGEMLRLGNDRQTYRFLESVQDAKDQRVLLRVIGPPYYTLLRAVDRLETKSGKRIRAYLERSPRVWIEIGYTHPLADQIRSPEGQLLLLRPARDWLYLEDKSFQDIYDILDFKLPQAGVEWEDSQLKSKLIVPLRLVPGNAADVAEMWLLEEDGINQLDILVRDADDRMMQRLSFAVAEGEKGKKQIIIRTRPSKLPPPVLPLTDALGFKPFWKLPNLFLPIGTRLQPTLRRDAVRKLLADDPAMIVWLLPTKGGKFTPETLPDEAFRPLEDWIDYVIDRDKSTLQNWIQATQFDFDGFVCKDDPQDRPKSSGGGGSGKPKSRKGDDLELDDEPIEQPTTTKKKSDKPKSEKNDYAVVQPIAPPNELKIKQEELEKAFLDQEGSLDGEERLALWPQLATIYGAQNNINDAAICWMNVIWERDQVPLEWIWTWVKTESKKAQKELTKADLDVWLKSSSPTPGEVRSLVAQLVWACRQDSVPQALHERLPEIHKFLENQEKQLGVRAIWLAWTHLAQLSGGDTLSIARVRDRLLQRLLTEGLNSERDLPTFLRFAGLRDSERMRMVRDKVMHLEKMAVRWVSLDTEQSTEINQAYVKLMFAFGLARLGDISLARDRLTEAKEVLLAKRDLKSFRRSDEGDIDPVHNYLFNAFQFRIDQALAGKPHAGPLSTNLLDDLEELDRLPRYIVDRMREQSGIIEPQEKFDPYRMWKKQSDEFLKELAELPDIKKNSELQSRIEKLLKEGSKGKKTPEIQVYILSETLPLAPRIGEEFTTKLLLLVPAALEAINRSTDPQMIERQCILLERALFQAAHFDRMEQVQVLTNRFTELLKTKIADKLHSAIDLIAGQCLRSLRKLGMRDEIHRLLAYMANLVIGGQSLSHLRAKHTKDWAETVRTLLHLAGGWLYFGEVEKSLPFLDEAKSVLFDEGDLIKNKKFQEYAKLARTYGTVLGQGPVDMALTRIEELFRKMAKLPNTYTTASHYSRFHLNIVEDVVRAIVSEDFALGPTARRWLDDDEYLVRRRIHRDMRKNLSHHGL